MAMATLRGILLLTIEKGGLGRLVALLPQEFGGASSGGYYVLLGIEKCGLERWVLFLPDESEVPFQVDTHVDNGNLACAPMPKPHEFSQYSIYAVIQDWYYQRHSFLKGELSWGTADVIQKFYGGTYFFVYSFIDVSICLFI